MRVVADPDPARRARPSGRAYQRYLEMKEFQDSANRPYIHLVDGGVSDNLGVRGVLVSQHVAGVLDDAVLEPGAGADERHAALPGPADAVDRSVQAAVGAARRAPHTGRSGEHVRPVGLEPVRGDPTDLGGRQIEARRRVPDRRLDGLLRFVGAGALADDGDPPPRACSRFGHGPPN